jgi:hypothetical protein
LIVSGELGFGCPHCLGVFTGGSVSSSALWQQGQEIWWLLHSLIVCGRLHHNPLGHAWCLRHGGCMSFKFFVFDWDDAEVVGYDSWNQL